MRVSDCEEKLFWAVRTHSINLPVLSPFMTGKASKPNPFFTLMDIFLSHTCFPIFCTPYILSLYHRVPTLKRLSPFFHLWRKLILHT